MKNKKGIKDVNGHNGANGHNGHNGKNGHSNGHNGHNGIHAANGTSAKDKSKDYRPTEKEPFMNERQKEYFRQKLAIWREDILKEAKDTLQHLQDENVESPRSGRPRLFGNRSGHRAPRPGSPAQADQQDRCCTAPSR